MLINTLYLRAADAKLMSTLTATAYFMTFLFVCLQVGLLALAEKSIGLHRVMTAKSNIQYPEGKISNEEPQRRKREKKNSQGR